MIGCKGANENERSRAHNTAWLCNDRGKAAFVVLDTHNSRIKFCNKGRKFPEKDI